MWDQANTAYINNDFPTAISLYETILSSGRQSGKLYYNLANAYFKEQEIGRAILNYNRALRLNPGNEDIRYNLQVAEKMTKDHIDAVPEFFVKTWLSNLRNLLSSTTWAVLSLVFLAAMLGSALFLFFAFHGTHALGRFLFSLFFSRSYVALVGCLNHFSSPAAIVQERFLIQSPARDKKTDFWSFLCLTPGLSWL